MLYERIAAGEVTIENLDNGEGAFLSLHYIPLMGNNAQSHAGEIGLSEVSDSKEETIPLKLKFSVERGTGPHPPQPNRYTPERRWRLRP